MATAMDEKEKVKAPMDKRFIDLLKRPWSMITDNRIFRRNFAVYGRLR
jgi:hypothetical protein